MAENDLVVPSPRPLLVALNPSPAQQDTGVITGAILDASGAPIANAVVEVKKRGVPVLSCGSKPARKAPTRRLRFA